MCFETGGWGVEGRTAIHASSGAVGQGAHLAQLMTGSRSKRLTAGEAHAAPLLDRERRAATAASKARQPPRYASTRAPSCHGLATSASVASIAATLAAAGQHGDRQRRAAPCPPSRYMIAVLTPLSCDEAGGRRRDGGKCTAPPVGDADDLPVLPPRRGHTPAAEAPRGDDGVKPSETPTSRRPRRPYRR